jgi:hypothetical protein
MPGKKFFYKGRPVNSKRNIKAGFMHVAISRITVFLTKMFIGKTQLSVGRSGLINCAT